ncbi:rhomboid family intramembrane serine protease [Brevundimonas sp. TWP2-3-2]|uniref:rhomboid family intramembrane serine protease n=1 Tax=unclassified Brevundimonas TaxID=2622653 RepID=UPI003CE9D035
MPDRFAGPPPRERIFNAPLLAVLLAASMPALYVLQERSRDNWLGLAFAPVDLGEGRYGGLFTSMLVHGGWVHALMNAVAALTFGAPVARLFRGPAGAGVFLALYICAGIFATLGYGLVHLGSPDPLVGASGAVFGLIGAATRLLGGGGRVLPLTNRSVITTSIAWMGINAVVGLIGFAPGAEGATIAWEAHAFGFLFGILAIGPLARLFARPDERFDSSGGLGDPLG